MHTTDYDLAKIGNRIKRARNIKGYTQEDLAEIIDINTKNISRLENGNMGLSVPTLIALCSALEVSADYLLFDNTENMTKTTQAIISSQLSEENKLQTVNVLKSIITALES